MAIAVDPTVSRMDYVCYCLFKSLRLTVSDTWLHKVFPFLLGRYDLALQEAVYQCAAQG